MTKTQPDSPSLVQTFRWYGPGDVVSLSDIRQAGASGVVTALHHIPVGEVWEVREIMQRKAEIESAGLSWEVVESVNIHESIKMGSEERGRYIEQYKETLQNLSECGIRIVCYNFMPVLDWTRTNLDYRLPDGASALKFDMVLLAAFDLFILQRDGADTSYSREVLKLATEAFAAMPDHEKKNLQTSILAGLPGTKEVIPIETFRDYLEAYKGIGREGLRENLKYFLQQIVPPAEKLGVKMCIHPDDPPYQLFDLPRVVCNADDLTFLLNTIDSPSNGITFCTGSLGPRPENDLPEMVRKFGARIHFLHLRNIQRTVHGSFFEAVHLGGDVDMASVMQEIVLEMQRRFKDGRDDFNIPVRPDHGHKILDDLTKNVDNPGYSAIGRLKGLAELRGLEMGLKYNLKSYE